MNYNSTGFFPKFDPKIYWSFGVLLCPCIIGYLIPKISVILFFFIIILLSIFIDFFVLKYYNTFTLNIEVGNKK